MPKNMEVNATVSLDIQKAKEQAEELVGLLQSANSLVNELAGSLKDLKFDINERRDTYE